MRKLITSLVFLSGGLAMAQGPVDGFFKSPGELDLAFSGTYGGAKQYFAGTKKINLERNQAILSAYGAYGLSDRWNAIVSLPIINFVPQDIGVFVKYKLLDKGGVTIAPAVGVSLPMVKYNTEIAQSIGQRATTIQPKLVLQYKAKGNWFVQAQGGYNYSLDPVPSAYVASAKVGYILGSWYFDAWFDHQTGIDGNDYTPGVKDASFRELGVSHNRVGGVIYKTLSNKWGVFINGSYVLSGRNTSITTAVGAGAVLKLHTKKKE